MKKIFKYLILFVLTLGIGIFIYAEIYGNFHKIDNDAYRSAKLNKYILPYYLKNKKIKTIINVHGSSSKPWYNEELRISKELKIAHIDFKMNSGKFYDYNQLSSLIEIMKNAQKPILIHCLGGADRTGLASALYEYKINNKSVEESKKQLDWIYGHIPSIRKHVIAMDESFNSFIKKDIQTKEKNATK